MGSAPLARQNRIVELLTMTNGTAADAVAPVTVLPDKLPTVMLDPSRKLDPVIVIAWPTAPNATGEGVTDEMVGCGAFTTNPPANVAPNPPAGTGLVTVTAYDPGANSVFGHQNFTWVLFTITNGTPALAVNPGTVSPDKDPTVSVAPLMKLVPNTVTEILGDTPYVSGVGATAVTVGCGATTVKAPARVTDWPPAAAGFSTWTAYDPGASAVLGHQNLTWPELTKTYGMAAVAGFPATVGPDKEPTVIVAPSTKFDPKIVTD
jgi:hypothetical protein